MQGIHAWVIFLAILVIGDLISMKTKARVPMLFASLFIYYYFGQECQKIWLTRLI